MSGPITNYNYTSSGPITVSQSSVSERTAFIAKVYGLVFLGIIVFFASAILPTIGMFLGIPVLSQIGYTMATLPVFVPLLLIIASSFIVHFIERIPVINVIGLFGLATMWGLLTVNMIAYACIQFAPAGAIVPGQPVDPSVLGPGLAIVLQAAIITFVAFGALTAYVMITKQDFSFLRGFLFVGMIIVMVAIVGALIFSMIGSPTIMGIDFNVFHFALSVVITLLMVGYILYDTSNVIHHYPTTMVVAAALALMVDFIILFRQILFFLINSRR
ncbi:MAG: Bax inhibitor-1 family protein [Sumerlaeia bacterium]